MAEPLQRLFSDIRSRPRRIKYEPFQGFGQTDRGGMRSTLPANALDTQAATDVAQGIDLDSVAPTRLNAGNIQLASYNPDQAAADMEGGDEQDLPPDPTEGIAMAGAPARTGTPARAVSTSQDGTVCIGGQCYRGGQAIPPGISLGPGETYVQGSLREVPVGTVATTATAQPGQQAQPQQDPFSQLNVEKPQTFFNLAADQFRKAQDFAASQRAVQAAIADRTGQQAMMNGMTAAIMLKRDRIAQITNALTSRGMDLREKQIETEAGLKQQDIALRRAELDAKTGDDRARREAEIRNNRELSVAARAEEIVNNRVLDFKNAGLDLQKTYEQMLEREHAIITAKDLSHYVLSLKEVTDQIRTAKAGGASPAQIDAMNLQYTRINSEIAKRLKDRYGAMPAQDRDRSMRNELLAVYEDAYRTYYQKTKQDVGDAEISDAAISTVMGHIDIMDEVSGEGYDPMAPFFEAMRPSAGAASSPAALPAAAQGQGMITSGSGSGPGASFSPGGTMSLAR